MKLSVTAQSASAADKDNRIAFRSRSDPGPQPVPGRSGVVRSNLLPALDVACSHMTIIKIIDLAFFQKGSSGS
jgi:hypothetical protein